MLAGFTRKKASTRRVNRKIADSTRKQRVIFSRYLAANYGDAATNASRGGSSEGGARVEGALCA